MVTRRIQSVQMPEIELQRVDMPPEGESALADIPRAIGFLLTRLLSHDQALLHAEYRRTESEVTWYVRARLKAGEGEDEAVATLAAGTFSSILARLAVTFGIDYTTSGCATGTMLLEGRRFDCRIFLSKCKASGYWIRIYTVAA
jgi:hypothetical protein